MTLQAGDLRRRITIQKPTDTRTSSGGSTRTWTTVSGCSSVPAKIVYPTPAKKGDEVYTQGQLHSAVFATFTIRYRPSTNIDASMRVVYGARTFEVRTVFPVDELQQEITMQCEELQGAGTLH